jgi:uroporphyrin-III C-methyltransferase/precorrin-2 dehydrogenase/sirohydrochlorin ferrochelatase
MTMLLGLDVTGTPVLVAGGGPVAARRARTLAREGATVRVVAPQLCEDLVDLVLEGAVAWAEREVEEADVDAAWLVHAATDDRQVNADVCRWATARRVWSVNASDSAAGTARTPATTAHAGLVVGVASAGSADPRRAAAVRDELEAALHCSPVDLRRRRRPGSAGGRVVLVGGGPGAGDLITVRGRRALAEADVVVTDRLGPTSLLEELPEDVEVVDVGKAPGNHAVPQDQINAILVEQARRGRTVVRLKGGDPFLLGRGGEEVLACRAHGIPVEVVPGVSSALAAPAAAGIPVTHRGLSAAVHIVHGHERLGDAAAGCVVTGSATLVVLMGVALLGEHVERLLAAGADPATPVAVVEQGTLEGQRVTQARLDRIAGASRAAGVRAPAVIVVGHCAAPDLLAGPLLARGGAD